ncbi:MAG: multidrug ABC transporter permease [Bacteroidetes bacterium GWA2_32_17]|nr:MAG: multidrug ABC transporter permease [Bacteroidetes bacterium GWA2_32_17]
MKKFIGFVKKEYYHIIRDPRTLFVLIAMPIAQILLFGYVITNEIKNASIGILDHSNDEITKQISSKILSSGYFKLDASINSEQEIHEAFRKGKIKEVIVFEPHFSEKLKKEGTAKIQIIADASDPNIANLLTNYTEAIIRNYSNSITTQNTQISLITPEVRMLYNSELKGAYLFVPGIIAMLLMLISALMTSISITREKELGTMEVLLASPLNPFTVIAGKVTPYLMLSFIDACLILLTGYFVFNVPVNGSIILLLAECLLFIFMALSLGILISTATKSQQAAMLISLVALMLPTILLSGFIFPVENMPLILQYLCKIMPPKYFINIVRTIMLKGGNLSTLWSDTLILAGMSIFFILVSVRKYKIRLE